jgi:asparagine synthase (glutamine-hydrolysing)
MCGIAGFLSSSVSEPKQIVEKMIATLHHRGPDGTGVFVKPADGIAMAHKRLAILDLSPLGSQPMFSHSGRFIICFNGEIYNYQEIRKELIALGHSFKGNSDTEVILAAFEQWEIYEAVPKFNGMFAIVLWDQDSKRIYLIRDRIGVKPLYYGTFGTSFVFGSELKSILEHPAANNSLSALGLNHFMRFGYIPAPLTIYENIHKVNQGSILTVTQSESGLLVNEHKYWTPVVHAMAQSEMATDPGHIQNHLHSLIRDSVSLRMISDVQIGSFLSGGVDSTLITAIMQSQSKAPINTYTIGFTEAAFDESKYAEPIAQHLGTNHTTLMVSAHDSLGIIPELADIYDEPFGDYSSLPTLLLSKLTSSHVRVALSGDGGDELFLGYSRYQATLRLWNFLKFLPSSAKSSINRFIDGLPLNTLNSIASLIMKLLPRASRITNAGPRLQRFASRMDADSFPALYRNILSHWPKYTVKHHSDKILPFLDDNLEQSLSDQSFMSVYDLVSYLPDDIMTKVDRASMHYALEAREPLLDHRIVEYSLKMPNTLKQRGGESKWILKRILDNYLPSHLLDRPKMGFGVPLDEWLRGPLKNWADHLLCSRENTNHALLDFEKIEAVWKKHLNHEGNHAFLLWDALMFQSWMAKWKPNIDNLRIH